MKMRIFCKSYFSIIKENIKNLYFTYNDFLKKANISTTSVFYTRWPKEKLKKWKIKTYPCMIVQFHFSIFLEKWIHKKRTIFYFSIV